MDFWDLLLSGVTLAVLWAGWWARDRCGVRFADPLVGIWRERTAGPLVGYLYFTDQGAVYYMASKIPATEEMFTEKYKIAASCWGRTFDRWTYTLEQAETGELLAVSGEGIGGVYEKMTD